MKKAVVVGGSNGIGLAITRELIAKDYHVYIFDVREPDESILADSSSYTYEKFNLLDFYVEPFRSIAIDNDVEILVITAGFGRCTYFDNLNIGEINNIITVNTTSTLKIIKLFYDRMKYVFEVEDKNGETLQELGYIKDKSQLPPYNLGDGTRVSGGSMFDTVIALRNALLKGDQESIGGRVLGTLDLGIDKLRTLYYGKEMFSKNQNG